MLSDTRPLLVSVLRGTEVCRRFLQGWQVESLGFGTVQLSITVKPTPPCTRQYTDSWVWLVTVKFPEKGVCIIRSSSRVQA